MNLRLILAILPRLVQSANTVQVVYGFSQVDACPGDTVVVEWTGSHNIQETETEDCTSADIDAEIVGYQPFGQVQNFTDELVAQPGTTRYFKCDTHCSATDARFEVSCPCCVA